MDAEPTGQARSREEEADAAWAEVEARWQDDEAHRAFLARHPDLESLAEAGRRYRKAMEERPGDAVALRWRDEVLKRATVIAMAQLPRTAPPRRVPSGLRRALLLAAVAATAGAAAWVVLQLGKALR